MIYKKSPFNWTLFLGLQLDGGNVILNWMICIHCIFSVVISIFGVQLNDIIIWAIESFKSQIIMPIKYRSTGCPSIHVYWFPIFRCDSISIICSVRHMILFDGIFNISTSPIISQYLPTFTNIDNSEIYVIFWGRVLLMKRPTILDLY